MAPIRLAIIGLSSSAKTSWASNAHLPYLLSPRGEEKYQIVALCNSSVQAARDAISTYGLGPGTKAYGDPESLAADKEVDFVVNCTRVDVHHGTILPSVKAGKSVFVEWPLAQDAAHARELVEAARTSGSRTVMGMQGRLAPIIVKTKEILEQGLIGKVLSSEVRAAGGSVDREKLVSSLEYFTDKKVGGNVYTIGLGHLFDQIQYVLGDFTDIQSRLQLQRPDVKLRDGQTQQVVKTVRSNVPDLVFFAAGLGSSPIATSGASVLVRHRRGPPFPGVPALEWTINGEKGELKLTAQDDTTIHASAYKGPVKLEVHDFETDKVEEVSWDWQDWQAELGFVARSIGAVYEEFAKGEPGAYATFDDALKRHEQLAGMLDAWVAPQ